MPRKLLPLTEQIQQAIDASGMSRYRVCKLIGLSESTMSRFMSGQTGLSCAVLNKLGELLGLRIVADRQAAPQGQRTVTSGQHRK
jgi:transcriptional regulator with XRE-family HTH domain